MGAGFWQCPDKDGPKGNCAIQCQSILIFTKMSAASSSASIYLHLFTSTQITLLVFPKFSLVWVRLVNIAFSLPALITRSIIVIRNILKCDLIYILKTVGGGKALERNYSILICGWEKRDQMEGGKKMNECVMLSGEQSSSLSHTGLMFLQNSPSRNDRSR